MGTFETQVFLSLTTVLGAAGVALVCDYLRSVNRRLRESNDFLRALLEQQTRREALVSNLLFELAEAERAVQRAAMEVPLASPSMPLSAGIQAAIPHAVPDALPDNVEVITEPAAVASGPKLVANAPARIDSTPSQPLAMPNLPGPEAPIHAKPQQITSPVVQMPSPTPRPLRLVEAGSLPLTRTRGRREPQSNAFDANGADEIVARQLAGLSELSAQRTATKTRGPASAGPAPTVFQPEVRTSQAEGHPIRKSGSAAASSVLALSLPGGFDCTNYLGEHLRLDDVFEGLVVTVRLLATGEAGPVNRSHHIRLVKSLARTVCTLGGDLDFTCRSSDDEFVLIYPRETGVNAEIRVQEITERLWDFQLRTLGTYPALIHWGAAESNCYTLRNLIESARTQVKESWQASEAEPALQMAAI